MTPAPRVSVLIAAMNEAETIEACVRRVAAAVGPDAEILVIDGGTDATGAIVRGLTGEITGARHVPNPHDRGKGHAIRVGIERARGALLAQIDADLQFEPEELPALLAPLDAGQADMVLGTRYPPRAAGRAGTTAVRSLGNLAMSGLASALFAHRMTDVLAGMKAWRREVTEVAPPRLDSYSYEVELPARALAAGFRVVDVPIRSHLREAGQSKVRAVRVGVRIGLDLLRLRAETLRRRP